MESDSDFLAPLFLHSKEINTAPVFSFSPWLTAWVSLPLPGMESKPPAVEAWSPACWMDGQGIPQSPRFTVTCLIGLSLLPAFLHLPTCQSLLQWLLSARFYAMCWGNKLETNVTRPNSLLIIYLLCCLLQVLTLYSCRVLSITITWQRANSVVSELGKTLRSSSIVLTH